MRSDKEVWDLVDFDPVVNHVLCMWTSLRDQYPEPAGQLGYQLYLTVREATYDRLDGKQPDGVPEVH